jgi:hypothetical protein
VTIGYDAAANTYTVQDGTTSANFTAADRTTSSGYAERYAKQAGLVSDELTIYGNLRSGAASGTAPLELSYVSYGLWSHKSGGLQLQPALIKQTFALIGYASSEASMPTSGTATYRTMVSALRSADGAIGSPIDGTATFTANFATSSVLTSLQLALVPTYTGSATINAGQFTGALSSTHAHFVSGSFAGGFFGPAAAEMGYVFAIHHQDPDPYAGAAVMPRDIWFNGVVLGAKQ